jgi:hypothetical protein
VSPGQRLGPRRPENAEVGGSIPPGPTDQNGGLTCTFLRATGTVGQAPGGLSSSLGYSGVVKGPLRDSTALSVPAPRMADP